MPQDNQKLQCYLNGDIYNEIKKRAEGKGVSASRYASIVLENHIRNQSSEGSFQRELRGILSQVLMSTYSPASIEDSKEKVIEVMSEIRRIAGNKTNT